MNDFGPLSAVIDQILNYRNKQYNSCKANFICKLPMKLTLNSVPLALKQLNHSPTEINLALSKQQDLLLQAERPQCTNCNVFCFSNNVLEGSIIIDNQSQSKQILPKDCESIRKTNLMQEKETRKHKISLSLQQQPLKRQQTPKKQSIHSNYQNRCYSQNKKEAIVQNQQHKNQIYLKKGMNLCKKNKTEPTQQQKLFERKMHLLKESLKPSTNTMSPVSESLKQSKNSNSTKIKLTISNNFKSSIAKQNGQQSLKMNPTILSAKNIESIPASQQVDIQQSFITAKLHNIYEEINSSFMQYSCSNIIQYNQIMANEEIWKHPVTFNHSQINPQGDHLQDKGEKTNRESKNQMNDINILQDMECEGQELQNVRSVSKKDIRTKFMERKFIGEYAKTIKTFNESELKEDNQSIVLQRGLVFQGQFPTTAFNRGTMKEQPRQQQSQDIKRHYSSFGQIKQESQQMQRGLFRQYISHPIYESSFDSQRQN